MINTNKLYCGDNLKVLKQIENNSVNTIITSPPYYNQRDYLGQGMGNESTENEYINNLIKVFEECYRIIKNDGQIVFNLGDKYINGTLSLLPYKFAIKVLETFGVKLINQITWDKPNPVPRQDNKKLIQATEPFFIFVKNTDYYFDKQTYLEDLNNKKKKSASNNIGGKYFDLISNSDLTEEEKTNAKNELIKVIEEVKNGKIESFRMKIRGIHALPYGGQKGGRLNQINNNGFTIIKISGNPIKRDVISCPVETIKNSKHPAIYPKYICEQLIKLLTKEDDIVLDPFCGSGTTCLVAKELNRQYIGIDIEQEYINYANERIAI